MDEHLVDLINRQIDGETSAAESAELRPILATNREALDFHDGIRRVVSEIESIGLVEPPPSLREEILSAVRGSRPASRAAENRITAPRFRGPSLFGYAWAIAAGIVFGFILHPLIFDNSGGELPLNLRHASGTLVSIQDAGSTQPTEIFATPDDGAALSLASRGNEVVVDIDLRAANPVTVTLAFDPSRFAFEELTRGAGAPRITVGNGHIGIAGRAGSRLRLRLARVQPTSSPVSLRLAKAGSEIGKTHFELVEQP